MKSRSKTIPLEQQREAFVGRRFLSMPIAGALVWTGIGIAGAVLPVFWASWAIFIGTGVVFYLGLLVARILGEDLLGREAPSPFFDRVFLLATVSALCVFAIAIPFFRIDPTSLPLSVGILTGLMWIPFSGLVGHWVGIFHGVSRTLLVLVAWYVFPDARFVAIPAVIVAIYVVSIVLLQRRYAGVVARPNRP